MTAEHIAVQILSTALGSFSGAAIAYWIFIGRRGGLRRVRGNRRRNR